MPEVNLHHAHSLSPHPTQAGCEGPEPSEASILGKEPPGPPQEAPGVVFDDTTE